jgi:hypothetical protein
MNIATKMPLQLTFDKFKDQQRRMPNTRERWRNFGGKAVLLRSGFLLTSALVAHCKASVPAVSSPFRPNFADSCKMERSGDTVSKLC